MHDRTASRRLALQRLVEFAGPGEPVSVRPHEGVGLVLAETARAACAVPEAACSLRDGYAVRWEDVRAASAASPVRLTIAQTVHAESAPTSSLGPGECARILTGGRLPAGGDAVAPEEDVTQGDATKDGGTILVQQPLRPSCFVRATGDEIEQGAAVINAREVVTPQAAAVLARSRAAAIRVFPRPTASVLALGSELFDPFDATPSSDETRFPADNLVLLSGLLEKGGVEVRSAHILPDVRDLLTTALTVDDLPDVVITTGGTGRSERDFARSGAERAGFEMVVDHVDIRPGWNMFVARRDGTLLFCLPGPPAAGFACFHAVILPTLRRLRGAPEPLTPAMARLTSGLSAKPGGEWLVPVELRWAGSVREASPMVRDLPAMLAMARADALAVIPPSSAISAGEDVEILLIGGAGDKS